MEEKNNFFKNVIVPFLSGIFGTFLMLGICFGVPSIKEKLISTQATVPATTITTTPPTGTVDLVSLSNYSDTTIYSSNKVLPSIVGIKVDYTVTSNSFFYGQQTSSATAEGSGVIISQDGYILTNNHVVSSSSTNSYYSISEANKITVYLYNDTTPYEATIIGADSQTDLAVIKIEKNDLTAAELGDSSQTKIGEIVLAIGNPLGLQSSVTSGIVSAVNREITDNDGNTYKVIQTDAAINSGNSGGALVNAKGQVIGINTLKMSGNGIEGVGFAIPINNTTDIYKQLIDHSKVLRPYIGITGINLDEKTAEHYNLPIGIYIKSIDNFSPAEKANLKNGDVITKADNTVVSTVEELNDIKDKKSIGDKIDLTIIREKNEINITVTLEEKP